MAMLGIARDPADPLNAWTRRAVWVVIPSLVLLVIFMQ